MPDNKEKYAKLQEVIEKHKGERGAVMPCLQEAMNIFGYVPQDVQEMIADGLGTTLSEVYGVSTFYSQFSLKPKGKHVIGVCLGTACYVKGSQKIIDRISGTLSGVRRPYTSSPIIITGARPQAPRHRVAFRVNFPSFVVRPTSIFSSSEMRSSTFWLPLT